MWRNEHRWKQRCGDTIVYLSRGLLSVVIYQDVWWGTGKLGWVLVEEYEIDRVHLKYMSQLGLLETGSWQSLRGGHSQHWESSMALLFRSAAFVQVCVAQEQNQKHGQTHWWAMGLSFSFEQIGRWQKTKHAHASQTEIGQMCETTRFIRGMGESAVKVNWELGFNSLRGWVTNMYTEDWGNSLWLTAHPSEFSHYLLGKK